MSRNGNTNVILTYLVRSHCKDEQQDMTCCFRGLSARAVESDFLAGLRPTWSMLECSQARSW